ncbi:hypothetical protein HDG69_002877 [Isoptericola halotolerans]|uniref:Uncharacterized protein n=1 Tax=Isoptericola halotolerans TaxID=300560 RepID=A0ABX2A611_9MICO|nr:hypothetical protein [Isoptericola halotolerans]
MAARQERLTGRHRMLDRPEGMVDTLIGSTRGPRSLHVPQPSP